MGYYLTLAAWILGTLVFAMVLSYILRKGLSLIIVKYAEIIKADPTNFSFLKNSISFVIYILAFIIVFRRIPALKPIGDALFASAGVIAAVVGFASQKAFSNIISGVFILIFKPFHVGDVIEVSTKGKGEVEEITLRHTIIRNPENRRIIIPNSIISEETIINSNLIDINVRKQIEIPISHESNTDLAITIIKEEALNHELCIDNRTEEEKEEEGEIVVVRLVRITDFAIVLRAYAWAEGNDNAFFLKCDLLKSIRERFKEEESINIPYPQQIITLKDRDNQ